jgi:hypothetical protein
MKLNFIAIGRACFDNRCDYLQFFFNISVHNSALKLIKEWIFNEYI